MSKLLGEGALLVWLNIDEKMQNEVDRWYVDEHFPERITEVGYLRARRYQRISGGPAYMSLMEARTPAALLSEGYRRAAANATERTRAMRGAFLGGSMRSTHRVAASHSRASGGIVVCTHLRFEAQAERDAFAAWARRDLAQWMQAQPDVLAAHALVLAREVREEMDRLRTAGQQDEWADGVLLLEIGRASDLQLDLRTVLSVEAFADAGVNVDAVSSWVYQLMFGISADQV